MANSDETGTTPTATTPESEVVGNPPSSPSYPAPEDGGNGKITSRQASMTSPIAPVAAGKKPARTAEPQPEEPDEVTDKKGNPIMVRIHMNVTIPKLRHGNDWYSLEKNKVYTVPAALKKALLKRPGLLKPTY